MNNTLTTKEYNESIKNNENPFEWHICGRGPKTILMMEATEMRANASGKRLTTA